MSAIDLNLRTFIPVKNGKDGAVGQKTIFVFKQDGAHIRAHYSGGDIVSGHLLGVMDGASARLIYHCMTQNSTLKSGQATAHFVTKPDGRIQIYMDWQWLSGAKGKGESIYEEIHT